MRCAPCRAGPRAGPERSHTVAVGGATVASNDIRVLAQGLLRRAWRALPEGGGLPAEVWARRHRGMVTLLWIHFTAFALLAVARGRDVEHHLLEAGAVAAFALAASAPFASRRLRGALASLGLIS